MRGSTSRYNLKNAQIIYEAIKNAGINFLAYVPETWTNEILKLLLKDNDIEAIGAAGEDEAMAMCAGASLGGRRPMVLMEGSGYSTGTYAMSRLGLMHHMGWLMMSSHAGGIGEVAYYHWDIRLVGEPLLTALRIPHCVIQRIDDAKTLIREAQLTVEGQKVPVAVLLPHHILWEEAV
jgi:sulfopyruvate decarboxylase TPP-binding subunit